MKPSLPLLLCATLSAAVATAASADHSHSERQTRDMTAIVVSSPLLPMPHSDHTLDSAALAARRVAAADSAALLNQLPGLSSSSGGGVSSLPQLRGLGDDRVKIELDGVSLISACGNHMNPPLSYTDPSQIDELAVFVGVTPVAVGGDSIAGTIVVRSAAPQFSQSAQWISSGSLSSYYRSNGDGHGVNVGVTAANQQFALRYEGSVAAANNYSAASGFKPAGIAASDRGYLAGDEVGSTAFESHNHALRLDMNGQQHRFGVDIGYQHIPFQGFANQRMDMLDNTSWRATLRHSGDYSWGSVNSRLYWENTDHAMDFGPDKQFLYGTARGMPMETEGVSRGIAVDIDYQLGNSQILRYGVELQRYRLDDHWPASGGMMMAPDTFTNIDRGRRDRDALFAELQSHHSEQLSSLVGVRYERVRSRAGQVQGYNAMYAADAEAFNRQPRSQRDDNIDISAQLSYRLAAGSELDLGVARKVRSPNLYERYSWSNNGMAMRMINTVGDGNGYVGDVDLQPEIAHSITADWRWFDPANQQWAVTVSPFYTLVDDYIDAQLCVAASCNNSGDGFKYLQYANRDAQLWGVDLTLQRDLGNYRSGHWQARAVVSYLDAERRNDGDTLYNTLPLNALLTITQHWGNWTNSLEWQLVAAKDDPSQLRNEVATSGYGLVTLRSSWSRRQLRIDVGVENLFDHSYQLAQGGVYSGQGATMSATGIAWGIALPGPGRSLYVAANYAW
ncbi:TonB-dependent receptor [Gammaproteobacteria bacterium LSUCC0057]|uniref:TonB-dependent receptor n=1 Tax=Gammaproteobacteria bacterium LSUCC0057 TaxID=2559237 RepID=A0A4Y8UL59_9GAMM|nr:TonB-dependent receptor [Gammaproteobacteria bacterium LSUCC0057]